MQKLAEKWKGKKSSAKQILRETNFSDFFQLKNCYFYSFRVSEYHLWWKFAIFWGHKLIQIQIKNL